MERIGLLKIKLSSFPRPSSMYVWFLAKWLPIHLKSNIRDLRESQKGDIEREGQNQEGHSLSLEVSYWVLLFFKLYSSPTPSPGQSDEHLCWMCVHWMLALLKHRSECFSLVWMLLKAWCSVDCLPGVAALVRTKLLLSYITF